MWTFSEVPSKALGLLRSVLPPPDLLPGLVSAGGSPGGGGGGGGTPSGGGSLPWSVEEESDESESLSSVGG